MQDPSRLIDPRLEEIARQLAQSPPRLQAGERDALLYECGYAAGRQAATRLAWRWQVTAASLALVAMGLGMASYLLNHSAATQHRASASATTPQAPAVAKLNIKPTRPGMLLAGSSWEQIRAQLEAPAASRHVAPIGEQRPPRPTPTVGSARYYPDLWH